MITAFEKKIKEVETIFKESIEGKDSEITKLEKKLEIQQNNSESILEKVDKFESFLNSTESKYKCKDCDFASITKQGLKSHFTKKHKSKNQTCENLNFPKSCDLCEEELKSRREMIKHMRTHSYKNVQYQCEKCDFCGGDDYTMEVHIAKHHGDKFECGLFEYVAKMYKFLELNKKLVRLA